LKKKQNRGESLDFQSSPGLGGDRILKRGKKTTKKKKDCSSTEERNEAREGQLANDSEASKKMP